MAKVVPSGGLTPSLATLAVFARSPMTLADAGTELTDWPGARWERNLAHKHVPALVARGELRLVAPGSAPSLHRYEITSKGEKRRRAQLHSHVAGPAAIERDKAVAKIALCKAIGEVSVVIDSLRAEEELFDRAFEEVHRRSTEAMRARFREPERAGDDLCTRLADVGRAVEGRLWKNLSKELRHAREELETLRDEFRDGP